VSKGSVPSTLQVATLAQEAFLLFVVESMRFKSASVVKVNKLGALVPTFKCIRTNAINTLREISSEVSKRAESETSAERRKVMADSCSSLVTMGIDQDFVVSVIKKVADARRKVLEGVGKGIGRICATYTH